MSVNYSAVLGYGVLLTEEEFSRISGEMMDELIDEEILLYANHYDGPNADSAIIGIRVDSVERGKDTEVCVSCPCGEQLDKVLDILETLSVDREPTWHLLCEVR